MHITYAMPEVQNLIPRIQRKKPAHPWGRIWQNISRQHLSTTIRAVWFRAVHGMTLFLMTHVCIVYACVTPRCIRHVVKRTPPFTGWCRARVRGTLDLDTFPASADAPVRSAALTFHVAANSGDAYLAAATTKRNNTMDIGSYGFLHAS